MTWIRLIIKAHRVSTDLWRMNSLESASSPEIRLGILSKSGRHGPIDAKLTHLARNSRTGS